MEYYGDIFGYITSQEALYKKPIDVNTKSWNMKSHIERSALYRDSDIVGVKDQFTPIKNITRPILNLQYRTEDIDVKDVDIYVDEEDSRHLSFLVKKYYDDVFTQEYDLDSYFDALNQSRIDFGGGLSKDLGTGCPENTPLQSIAFCDQTDVLSGPVAIKHYYSPDQLLEMKARGWGKKSNGATISLEDLIKLSRDEKQPNKDEGKTETPGRYIEIYEIHGNLPKRFADDTYDGEDFETRIYICAFYQKKTGNGKQGVILYTKPEIKSPFKIVLRDPVFGRGLGFGGAEEIFESQVWTNYDEKRKLDMKDAASKTLLGAKGPNSAAIATKQKITDMSNNEILDLGVEGELSPINTFPINFKLFENTGWEEHAEKMGAATDPLLGEQSNSGTPFAAIQAQIQQGMGLHDYRRGKFAKHLEEIHKDWIIPYIEKEICAGAKFLTELSLEEMQYVTDSLVECEMEKGQKEFLLSNGGIAMPPELAQVYEQKIRESFKKKGNKHFIEILKGEFKNKPLAVKVSISGKSKNLSKATDALVNILKFAFSNPQGFAMTMQIPGMASAFNSIIEYAGLSPVDFSGISKMAMAQTPQPSQTPQNPQLPVQKQPAYG